MAWIVPKNGGFLVRWRDAKRRTISRYFAEEAAAKDFCEWKTAEDKADREMKKILRRATPKSERPAIGVRCEGIELASYLREYIESDPNLRQGSRETWLATVNKHIDRTELGRADIRSITPEMIQKFWANLYRSLARQNLPAGGNGVLRNVYTLVSKALTRARKSGLRPDNVLERADIHPPSKGWREEVVPLTRDEVEKLAEQALHPRDRLAILIMAWAGLRAGEVGGLREQDVSFSDPCRINVRQQVVQTHREKRVAPLKTKNARRIVGLPCSIADELRAYIDENGTGTEGRIFFGTRGNDLWAHSKINRQVHKAATAAKVRGGNVHSHMLRHTAVFFLIQGGAHPKDIQAFCGHASITTTLDTYGHWFSGRADELAGIMEKTRNGAARPHPPAAREAMSVRLHP